jgi:hypothetical protein
MYVKIQNGNELYHHGIKGQKWGIRRFQNEDGTRTAAGKKRRSYIAEGAKSIRSKIKGRKAKKNQPVDHDELVKSTNAKYLYKHRNQLSDAELANRVNRLNMEANLRKQAGFIGDMTMDSIRSGYQGAIQNTMQGASKMAVTTAIGTTAVKAGIPILAEAAGIKKGG